MSSLRSGKLRKEIEQAGGIKLIYIDPPFASGVDYAKKVFNLSSPYLIEFSAF